MENAIKHRINATNKTNDKANANDKTVASIFGFEILESGLPLYQYGLIR